MVWYVCMLVYIHCNSVFVCVVTSRSDRGVLSPSGRCCSRARTMQFAMMVVRIIHSNGVQLELRPTSGHRHLTHSHSSHSLLINFCFKFYIVMKWMFPHQHVLCVLYRSGCGPSWHFSLSLCLHVQCSLMSNCLIKVKLHKKKTLMTFLELNEIIFSDIL